MKEEMNLPENAFRELKDGEEYKPLMSPDKIYPEVNGWSAIGCACQGLEHREV